MNLIKSNPFEYVYIILRIQSGNNTGYRLQVKGYSNVATTRHECVVLTVQVLTSTVTGFILFDLHMCDSSLGY